MAVRPPAGHAEPRIALLRTPTGEILALRLAEDPEDDGSTRLRAAVAPRAGGGFSTHLSPSTAPFMEAPAAINVIAACQHAGG